MRVLSAEESAEVEKERSASPLMSRFTTSTSPRACKLVRAYASRREGISCIGGALYLRPIALLSLSLSHTHTHTYTHTHTHTQTNGHTHTITRTHTRTSTHAHALSHKN